MALDDLLDEYGNVDEGGSWFDEPQQSAVGSGDAQLDELNAVNPGWVRGADGKLSNPTLTQQWRDLPLNERYDGDSSRSLDYWAARGVDPEATIFTANGQLQQGWVRTANGYEYRPQTTTTNGGGGGGFSGGNYPGLPNPSDYPAPDPLAPWTESFKAPTAEEAAANPGFQFELGEGLKALERSGAAKGTLLTGGHLKGLQNYAIDKANTNYGDVYNRAYNEYDTRRTNFLQNEANRYNSQRGNRLDSWGIGSDYFNMGQAQRQTDFNIWNTQDMNGFNKLLELAKLRRPASPYIY